MLGGALLGLLGATAGLVQPLAAKHLVDQLGAGHRVTGDMLALGALVLTGAVLVALGYYVLERAAETVVCAARRRLAGRLLRLRVPVAECHEPGDLIARVTSDTTLLRQVATQAMASALTQTVISLLTVGMMALLDPVLLAVTLGAIALIAVVCGGILPRIGRAAEQTQQAIGDMASALERTFGAFRTVKACGAEQREIARLHEAAERARRTGVRTASWEVVSDTVTGAATQIAFLAVLGVGGARVAAHAISVSTLVAFLLYLFALAPRINQLAGVAGQLQVGAAAAVRIGETEDLPVEETSPLAPHTEPPGPAAVAFDGVSFAYRPGAPDVHREVSFTIPARGTTAFVGPSGAGKTTIFSLIERFWEPDAGRILLDGRDLRHRPLAELRAAIGYVEQDAPVLAGTLRENLLLGCPHATEDRLRAVLRRARLDTVADRLPQGLDTPVGHRGSALSGGERQRVALARALLRTPRLLLLDEATSQLDAANEAALRDTIADVARTTTVLVVAHRLSTVTSADRIVVMEAGRVRAVGTHARLVRDDALYAELAATQLLRPTE
ncbi:ABC transporter ATP-binding protein [Streptomyces sp. NPDC048506]|uniref:ABC transporter ATP-binding protein n=1 Tax=Streptomyces sp. NPDC048506 TaxID=3155028 RepID=UPI00342C4102